MGTLISKIFKSKKYNSDLIDFALLPEASYLEDIFYKNDIMVSYRHYKDVGRYRKTFHHKDKNIHEWSCCPCNTEDHPLFCLV